LVAAGINPLAFRVMCLGAKYRSELAFSLDAVRAAVSNLNYLHEFARSLEMDAASSEDAPWTRDYLERFHDSLNNDLNTPRSLAIVLELVAEAYRRKDQRIWNILKSFDQMLGLGFEASFKRATAEEIPAEILELSNERESARAAKDFKRADEIRRELEARGYEIRDRKGAPPTLAPKPRAP
jgi:cysteinyl-tRNA synthetase